MHDLSRRESLPQAEERGENCRSFVSSSPVVIARTILDLIDLLIPWPSLWVQLCVDVIGPWNPEMDVSLGPAVSQLPFPWLRVVCKIQQIREKAKIFQWTEQADSCKSCLLLTIPNPAKTGRSCNRLFRHLPPYSQTCNACLYYQRQSPTPLNTKTVWNGITAATSSALQCKDCRMQMHCWLCTLERMTQYLQAGAPDGAFPASKSQEKERGRKTHEVIRWTVCLTDSRAAIRFETSKLPLGISLREETTSVACRSSKGTVSFSATYWSSPVNLQTSKRVYSFF